MLVLRLPSSYLKPAVCFGETRFHPGGRVIKTRREFLAAAAAGPAVAGRTGNSPNTVMLRTHEWFGDRYEKFEFPSNWQVDVYHMKGHDTPALSAAEIGRAIRNPVGTRPLREIAAGQETVSIAFDDLTRPTPTYDLVPHVLAELKEAGIRDENILFVVGHAAHYQMNALEVAKKLGAETVRKHPWINHNTWENLVDLGLTRAKNQIFANAYYYKADVKITLSGVKAHGFAGYGGGPKLILPGVSGIRTIRYNHLVIKQSRGGRKDENGIPIVNYWHNEQRHDMLEAARKVGVNFSVQTVYNHERRAVEVVAGDIDAAHNRAASYAVNHLATEFARDADIVVVNSYPKGAQLHEHFGWGGRGLKDGGSIVVINQNPMGEYVWHYLDEVNTYHGESFFKQRASRKPRFPQASQVLLYSQYLQRRELDSPHFPPEAIGFGTWQEVIDRLKQQHRGDARVAVYPYAGMQHGIQRLDSPEA